MIDKEKLSTLAKAVIDTEIEAIQALHERINEDFMRACEFMLNCQGRVVVIGMGKSGHIGSKLAATLASTGTPAFFVHPGEASHGDLGAISRDDVVFAITWSGTTRELGDIVNYCSMYRLPLIVATANGSSWVGEAADILFHLVVALQARDIPLAAVLAELDRREGRSGIDEKASRSA